MAQKLPSHYISEYLNKGCILVKSDMKSYLDKYCSCYGDKTLICYECSYYENCDCIFRADKAVVLAVECDYD